MHLNWFQKSPRTMGRIPGIRTQSVNKKSQDFRFLQNGQLFSSLLEKNFRNVFKRHYIKNEIIYISTQNFEHFQKKDQLHSFNISEVIDSEKCGYLNARKLLFQNTLRESTRSRVKNTAEINMAALLSQISINLKHVEFENISVNQI